MWKRALSIACAKKNPGAHIIGIDRWGKEYASFSKSLWESFVEKLKNMGYEEVKLVDTTNGMFMSKWESTWMALTGSAILMGRK